MKIQLIDRNLEMCEQWKRHFENWDVIVHHGDFFSLPTDCVVSPANSFGFMDGGLDRIITNKLGYQVEMRLQEKIKKHYDGELLVGQATLIPTDHSEIPYCISAPTMRVPLILTDTVNVYLASKAIFLLLKKVEEADNLKDIIKTVTISGLGTGVGKVPYHICARQMKKAYDHFYLDEYEFPKTWREAQINHQLLYGNNFRDLQFNKN
jgi:O-acetyl-ADP-ribose deacetylase (regulator of RNase III)